jgi:hypothetical protein
VADVPPLQHLTSSDNFVDFALVQTTPAAFLLDIFIMEDLLVTRLIVRLESPDTFEVFASAAIDLANSAVQPKIPVTIHLDNDWTLLDRVKCDSRLRVARGGVWSSGSTIRSWTPEWPLLLCFRLRIGRRNGHCSRIRVARSGHHLDFASFGLRSFIDFWFTDHVVLPYVGRGGCVVVSILMAYYDLVTLLWYELLVLRVRPIAIMILAAERKYRITTLNIELPSSEVFGRCMNPDVGRDTSWLRRLLSRLWSGNCFGLFCADIVSLLTPGAAFHDVWCAADC